MFNPYSIISLCPPNHPLLSWAEPRRLRQHHGDTTIVDGEIVRRTVENEALWTGDFRIWTGDEFDPAIRRDAHYYAVVRTVSQLERLLALYNSAHPPGNSPPQCRRERLVIPEEEPHEMGVCSSA